MGVIDAVLSVSGICALAAAFASSSSPWCQHRPAAPVGAIASGRLAGLPNSVVATVRFDTSTSARWRSLMRSKAERLLATARWSSVARSTNSNTPFGSRRLAAARRSQTLRQRSRLAIGATPSPTLPRCAGEGALTSLPRAAGEGQGGGACSSDRIHHPLKHAITLPAAEEDVGRHLVHRPASGIGHRLIELVADQVDRLERTRLAAN